MCHRESWIEISKVNLLSNFDQFKKEINGKDLLPVVKANAYGHGVKEVSSILEQRSFPFLCVASIDEALELSELGYTNDILIFSYTSCKAIKQNHRENFIYTLVSKQQAKELENLGFQIRLHIELNLGMNRVGLKKWETFKSVINNTKHKIEGVYTHLPEAKTNDKTKFQIKKFDDWVKSMDYPFKWIHVGNGSIEIINMSSVCNAYRLGLGLYGYRQDLTLLPVLSLYSRIIYIDKIYPGETVGYHYAFTNDLESFIATVPIGYADGFAKEQEGLEVYINKTKYPIVGGICMDQTMLLVDENVQFYDIVELIGPNRDMESIEDYLGISAYEILVMMSKRLRRIIV